MGADIIAIEDMDFAHRLAALRKQRGLTQAVLAERVGVHPSQLRRYEAGGSQPSLEVLRNMARALAVTRMCSCLMTTSAALTTASASTSKPPAPPWAPTNRR